MLAIRLINIFDYKLLTIIDNPRGVFKFILGNSGLSLGLGHPHTVLQHILPLD